jgi:8-oxo-dGTP diphosphatase
MARHPTFTISSGTITSGDIVMNPKNPSLAVDCIVFDPGGRLLLIRRKNPPFQGQYALPGGYVDYGETTEHAAARELAEETGLVADRVSLVGVYSDPSRDPRGHVVSIAYRVETTGHDPRAGDDAAAAAFVADWETVDLAFDHRVIVGDAVRRRSACG